MSEQDWLAQRFEEHRRRLRAVAYRMLGSVSEAEDAVQEAWLRLSSSEPGEIENLSGWLTTVIARVSLNMLRSRAVRREEPLSPHLPDPIVDRADGIDPEHEALLADSVGLALLVVLETLTPPERLTFVLHDMFGVPFEEIARLIDRSPQAARQLASRARRRVRAQPTTPDPDVVLRADGGAALAAASAEVRGALDVARRAVMWSRVDLTMHPALVNGAAGVVATRNGVVFTIASVIVRNGKIAEMDFLADPERLARLDLTILDDRDWQSTGSTAQTRCRPRHQLLTFVEAEMVHLTYAVAPGMRARRTTRSTEPYPHGTARHIRQGAWCL